MQKPDDTEEVVDTREYDDVLELLGKDSKNLHRMGLFTGVLHTSTLLHALYNAWLQYILMTSVHNEIVTIPNSLVPRLFSMKH